MLTAASLVPAVSATAAPQPAVELVGVTHRYGERLALDGVGLSIAPGELFGLLGPNGGGKTTIFRLVSTLIPVQHGTVRVLGQDVVRQASAVRRQIGVVFQSASLDKKLTVWENLLHQGHLFGLSGAPLRRRADELLDRFRLADRRRDRVETLSGGLRRRVDLAKGLLHAPRLLLLDEPSTALDPGARAELWDLLRELRRAEGTTIVLTTHLLEEAEKVDRLAILDRGRIVALDAPDRLRATVGGDTLTLQADDPLALAEAIRGQFACPARVVDDLVRIELPAAHQFVPRIIEAFPGRIGSLVLGKPTLEDVFIARTGHRFEPRTDAPTMAVEAGHG